MNLHNFLKKIKELPTISAVVNEINTRARDDSLTAKSLGEIISRDPTLTATVLKLANSAYYGMAREITSIERAVTILGFDTIKNLALTISVFQVFKNKTEQPFDLQDLWHHSLGVGIVAKHLAQHSSILAADKTMPEQAFICGILHDIGKIAFAQNLPTEMAEILQQARSGTILQHEIEKKILGFNHQLVGEAMANAWNFPKDYQTAIKLHHSPSAATPGDTTQTIALVMAVYLGNKIAKTLHLGESTDPHLAEMTHDDLRKLGICIPDIPQIIPLIKNEYARCLEAWAN